MRWSNTTLNLSTYLFPKCFFSERTLRHGTHPLGLPWLHHHFVVVRYYKTCWSQGYTYKPTWLVVSKDKVANKMKWNGESWIPNPKHMFKKTCDDTPFHNIIFNHHKVSKPWLGMNWGGTTWSWVVSNLFLIFKKKLKYKYK